MHLEQNLTYQSEQSAKRSRAFLIGLIRVQIAIVIFLALIQVGATLSVRSQCEQILGLSISGRIVWTDSFTCPTAGVAPIYDGRPATLKDART